MEIATVTSDADLAALYGAWQVLHERAAATPFSSPAWIALCRDKSHAAPHARLCIVTAHDRGRLVFVLPLAERRDGLGFRTLGWIDSGTPCYADLVMEDSEAGRRGAEAAAAFLRRRLAVRRIRLDWVPEDAAAGHFLAACGARPKARLPVRRLYTEDYAGWEDFLRRMNARSRQGWRSRLRALEKLGPVGFGEVHDPNEASREVALIFARKRAALAAGIDAAHWLLAPETERLFRAAAAAGLGRVHRLTLAGRTIAADFAFHSARGLFISKSAYAAELSRYSPGRICRLRLIEHAFAAKIEFIDLMTGQYAWKLGLSSRQTSCAHYRVAGRLFSLLP